MSQRTIQWSAVMRMALLLFFASSVPAFAQHRLRDPFERPAPPLASQRLAPLENAASGENAWKPELRAVMFDGGHSLVDIGGRIMAIGDNQDGYRLIRIAERSAVLRKDGRELTLMLDKEKLP